MKITMELCEDLFDTLCAVVIAANGRMPETIKEIEATEDYAPCWA